MTSTIYDGYPKKQALEEAFDQARKYHKAWNDLNIQAWRFRQAQKKQIEFWQMKFRTVKHENNQLRKQLRKQEEKGLTDL